VLKPKFHVDECLDEIRECLEKGWTGLGFKTERFENEWKKATGHRNAHYLNSATAGLHLAVKILKDEFGWQAGDEIISTPITFVSTNHVILYEGLAPRFADVDEYMCLDPADVERKITPRTRAVMFVGYGGRVGRLDRIARICRERKLKLILDAAHMSGTTVNGVWPGTWDGVDAAVYSYQAVKSLPTADSGMVCFADEKLDGLCRKLAWLGIDKDTYARSKGGGGTYKWDYRVDVLGYKYHGCSVMASIGLVQLKYLKEDNESRRKLVELYDSLLVENEILKIVPAPHRDECAWHIYEIVVESRDALIEKLCANGIFPGVHYRDNSEYSLYQGEAGKCPNAAAVSRKLVTLPLHLWLTEDDVRKVAAVVNEFTAELIRG
jgi:dTDP-4-amino-4,6-dideoxygalactose transaminase